AASGLKSLADRGGDVRLRLADGVSKRVTAGQGGGDRGCEGATRPVGAGRGQPLRGEAREVAAAPEDVGGGVPEVAALHQHVLRTERQDPARRLLHVALGYDGLPC